MLLFPDLGFEYKILIFCFLISTKYVVASITFMLWLIVSYDYLCGYLKCQRNDSTTLNVYKRKHYIQCGSYRENLKSLAFNSAD